jgi:outer membrane receptor protein involved in Fe transport
MRWFIRILLISLFLINSGYAQDATPILIQGANPDYNRPDILSLGDNKYFNRKDIESFTPLTTDIFLKQVPGFSLFRRSNSLVTNPTAQGVSLRGTGPSGAGRTIVTLDGIPINDPFGGWVNWQRVPTEGIENINVQENWGSNHWSFLGLGSSINIETKIPASKNSEVKLLGGTQETGLIHGFTADAGDNFNYILAGQAFTTGGYKIIAPEDRGDIDENADSSHLLSYGKISRKISDNISTYILGNIFNEDRGNGTPLTGNETELESIAGGTSIRDEDGGRLRMDLIGSHGKFESTFSSQAEDRNSEIPASNQFNVPSDELGFKTDWGKNLTHFNYIEAGADYMYRKGESDEDFRFQDGAFQKRRFAGAEQNNVGLYAYNKYLPRKDITFDSFIRFDFYNNKNIFRREEDLLSNDLERDDSINHDLKSFISPRLQFSWQLNKEQKIRTALTRNFRSPTVNELVRPFRVKNDITEANPDLKIEEIRGLDIEYKYEKPFFELYAIPYFNEIRNGVSNVTVSEETGFVDPCGFVPEGGVCRQRKNLPSSHSFGVESGGMIHLSNNLVLKPTYLFTYSKVDDSGEEEALNGKSFAQLPRNTATLRTEALVHSIKGMFQLRYVGKQYEDDLNSIKLDPFVTIDAGLSYPLTPSKELYLSAQNILGDRFETGKTKDNVTTLGEPLIVLIGARIKF